LLQRTEMTRCATTSCPQGPTRMKDLTDVGTTIRANGLAVGA